MSLQIGNGLGLSIQEQVISALSPVKAKIEAKQNASILVIGDSTAYSKFGPYYLFFAWLGSRYNYTIRIRRWDEWEGGVRDYAAAETVWVGANGILDIWLAALPGSVVHSMFDSVRKPKAITALTRPDLVMWHHGHNVQTFETQGLITSPTYYSLGRGLFFAGIGMVSYIWPGVPQALVNQTPWRDNTGMAKIVSSIAGVKSAKSDITVIDTASPFTPNKGNPLYYRNGEPTPGVHPSDMDGRKLGALIQAQGLLEAWDQSKGSPDFTTADWVKAQGVNLCPGGDFAWPSGTVPTGWSVSGGATATKNTTQQFPGFDYCVEVNGGATAILGRLFSAAEVAPMLSKTVSVAILAKRSAGQTNPYMTYLATSGGATRTLNVSPFPATGADRPNEGDWNWYVAARIPLDATITAFLNGIRIYPSFNVAGNGTPLFVQKVVIIEGDKPAGLMAA